MVIMVIIMVMMVIIMVIMVIRSERARMGGDWAVCSILLTRKIREVVRWNFLYSCKQNYSLPQRGVGRGTSRDLLKYAT